MQAHGEAQMPREGQYGMCRRMCVRSRLRVNVGVIVVLGAEVWMRSLRLVDGVCVDTAACCVGIEVIE